MTRNFQTRLSDFGETKKKSSESSSDIVPTSPKPQVKRQKPARMLWKKTTSKNEEWGVCDLNNTVILVRLIDGRIHAHGQEAVCKWCGGVLEIRDDKIFCSGACERYQGEFSRDLNSFLWWEGVKSYTLRRIVAEIEHLELEPRDHEPIDYAPNWSILYEYEDEFNDESESAPSRKSN
jgi:hypothetical protein